MKALLILNPTAGRSKAANWEQRALQSLHGRGIDCEIALTNAAGDGATLAKRAVEQGCDLVIAAGGDGTVNEVANGLVGSETILGILPLGTVNVLARELKIPLRTTHAIRVITDGDVKRIDMGCADGRYFLLMAGFGFDAAIVAGVLQPIKDWIGSSAYALKGLEILAKYRPTDITLEMDEETYCATAFMVVVANVSTYGYDMKIAPLASHDDGLLDICVFERPMLDTIGFAQQVADIFANRHLYHKAVKYFRTSSVKVSSVPEVLVQLDGDTFCSTPVNVTVAKRVLPVMVPKA